MRDRYTHLAAFFTLACGSLCSLSAQPDNPASWKTLSGPAGGSVASLADDGDDLYAGLSQSGVFRLAGKTGAWQPVQDGLGSRSVHALARLSVGLFAATDSGLFRLSQDRKTWSPVTGTPRTPCYSLFSADGLALAGTDTGILRSADGGDTWAAIAVGEYPYVFALAGLGRFLYAGSENSQGIFRSEDKGLSWTQVKTGLLLDDGMSVYAMVGHPETGQAGKVLAATSAGLYVSADSGTHWAQVTQGVPNQSQFTSLSRSGSQGSLLYAGTRGTGVFQSVDGGAAWTPIGIRSRAIVNALLPVDGDIWAGTLRDGVLRRKAAGSAWEEMNAGLTGIAPTDLACDQSLMAAAWQDKIYVSRDGGAAWSTVHQWESEPEAVSVALWQGRLYVGTDEGLWDADLQASSTAPPALRRLQDYKVNALFRMDDSLFVHSDEGLWRWSPGAASPVLSDISTKNFTVLDAGSGWLRGYERYGSYGEYATDEDAWTLFDAPQLEPQSLITLDSIPVLATESLEAYALRREASAVSADRILLPFPVSAFCRDGGRIFAGTAGNGIAEYLGKGPAGIVLGRKSIGMRRTVYGPARATRFPAPGGMANGWFDASGRIHPR